MGSLLTMLLLLQKRVSPPKPTLGTSANSKELSKKGDVQTSWAALMTRAKLAAWAAVGEVLGALLALLVVVLVVVSAVLFFYLFCLPWMGSKVKVSAGEDSETRISRRA